MTHALGHHHDPGERIDANLETSEAGIRAVKISLVILLATAGMQAIVVALSGSVALLADTLHNVADALTAIPLWIAFRLGRRAPTRRYNYGLGRAEDLAGLFVISVIAVSAILAVLAAIDRLFSPRDIDHLALVGAAAVIGFLGNEAVARYRIGVGNRIGSAALVADGLHARTDALTSLAVGVSVAGVAMGYPIVDPIVAIVIAVLILKILVDAARHVLRRTMDGVDEGLVTTAEIALENMPFVGGVDDVRLRWVGHRLWAEIDISVDPELTLSDAHVTAHEAEHALYHETPQLAAPLFTPIRPTRRPPTTRTPAFATTGPTPHPEPTPRPRPTHPWWEPKRPSLHETQGNGSGGGGTSTRPRPVQVWLADITEHRSAEGKIYLCAIKDLWSNRIVGWAIDSRMKARLVVAAIEMAVARRGDVAGCILHSDHRLSPASSAPGRSTAVWPAIAWSARWATSALRTRAPLHLLVRHKPRLGRSPTMVARPRRSSFDRQDLSVRAGRSSGRHQRADQQPQQRETVGRCGPRQQSAGRTSLTARSPERKQRFAEASSETGLSGPRTNAAWVRR